MKKLFKATLSAVLALTMLVGIFSVAGGALGYVSFSVTDYSVTTLDWKTVDSVTLYLDTAFADKAPNYEDIELRMYSKTGDNFVKPSPAITVTVSAADKSVTIKFNKSIEPSAIYRISIPENALKTATDERNASLNFYLYGMNLLGEKDYTGNVFENFITYLGYFFEESELSKALNFKIEGLEFNFSILISPLMALVAVPYAIIKAITCSPIDLLFDC